MTCCALKRSNAEELIYHIFGNSSRCCGFLYIFIFDTEVIRSNYSKKNEDKA